jgi:hypothetical protein
MIALSLEDIAKVDINDYVGIITIFFVVFAAMDFIEWIKKVL